MIVSLLMMTSLKVKSNTQFNLKDSLINIHIKTPNQTKIKIKSNKYFNFNNKE